MICLICRQAEIIESFTSVSLGRGEMHLIIDSVPARVCPSCGEAYVVEEIASHLLRIGKEISEAGALHARCEYSNV
jgi:YgiT-type zinc finger domain-containing protein